MRLRKLLAKSLRDQRFQIAGFGLALGLMAAFVVFIWPAYRDQLQLIELPPAVEALLGSEKLDFRTAPGFINAEFFTWTPVLLIVYAITQGTGAIAGEESAGTADLLLAQPVRRGELILVRTASAMIGMVAVVALGYAGFLLSIPFVSIDVTLWDAFLGCVNLLPLGLFFYALSLWLGAVMPARVHAVGVATAVATFAFFADTIAAGVEEVRWMRYGSPYYYFGRGLPLVEGIDWAHAGVLLGLAALFVALALRAFERRDVTPGGATNLTFADLVRRVAG